MKATGYVLTNRFIDQTPAGGTVSRKLGLVIIALAVVGLCGCTPTASHPHATKSPQATLPAPPPGRLVYRKFLDSAETTGALFVSKSDGSGEVQVTKPSAKEIDGDPHWSPDGKRIVFDKFLGLGSANEVHQIEVINADGTRMMPLSAGTPAQDSTIPGFDDQAVFSPDGKMLAYSHADGTVVNDAIQHSGLWVMNSDGTEAHAVLTLPDFSGAVGGFAWSPDGTKILYGVINSGMGTPAGGRAFFIVNADGTGVHQLGSDWTKGDDGNPSWSVATDTIVFRVAPDEESGVGNFFTLKPDGTGRTQVTHYSNTLVSHKVSFSPDGKWIVYGVNLANGIHVAVAKIDGTGARVLHPSSLGSSAPDWGPAP